MANGAMAAMIGAGLADSSILNSIPDFDKPAGERCPHQRHGKGCAVYERRPFGCKMWVCRWLAGDDTADMSRPDRVHYVIDVAPDFVRSDTDAVFPVIQIWVDPKHRDAYKDPALLEFLKRRSADGYHALIRYNANEDCFFLYYHNGEFHEKRSELRGEHAHSALEKAAVLGGLKIVLK